MKIILLLWACISSVTMGFANKNVSDVWVADIGNGKYKNPIIYADYSDPDVCRVGDDYFLTSSSFNCIPGLQILHSKDLVNWEIISAAIPFANIPEETYNTVQHGCAVWAPCIRHHQGRFYIFWGDPDVGILMTSATEVTGQWTTPCIVKEGKGYIDPSPLWDDDGKVYLTHAMAGSRGGLKNILFLCELSADASHAITESRIIFDGHTTGHTTIEGTKFYKYNNYYYIFAPAGGVPTGYQVVLRSKNPYGPYEDRIVMAQENTEINGPHQGGWVETPYNEHWFIHFQDVGAYGRIIHLQPMQWRNDGWPIIGIDSDNDGCGEPVSEYRKPKANITTTERCTPADSDEFDTTSLGLQWQWHANYDPRWCFCDASKGVLRLFSFAVPQSYRNLYDVSNLLLQKTPAKDFVVTTKISFSPSKDYTGERTGLLVMGQDYAGLIIENTPQGLVLSQVECLQAHKGKPEKVNDNIQLSSNTLYLRAQFRDTGEFLKDNSDNTDMKIIVDFTYSLDGKKYKSLGTDFILKEGKWIGAKVGSFCTRPAIKKNDGGWVDIDWFRITKLQAK